MILVFIVIDGCIGDGFDIVGVYDSLELAKEIVAKRISEKDQGYKQVSDYDWNGERHSNEYLAIVKKLMNDYQKSES